MMLYQQRFWAVMEVILLAIVLIVFVIVLDIVYLFKRLWKGDLESAELEHN